MAVGGEVGSANVDWWDVEGVVVLRSGERLGNGDGLRLFSKLGLRLRLRVYLDGELLVQR